MKKFIQWLTATLAILIFGAGAVFAADYTLFGNAEVVPGGNPDNAARLVSDMSLADPYGAVAVSETTFDLSSLTTLSTDFNVTDDDCGWGAPRFSIKIDYDLDGVPSAGDKNIFVYLGPYPNYTGCTPNTWTSSGNLVTDSNLRWDSTQLGGPWYGSYSDAVAAAAGKPVVRVSVVVDGGGVMPDGEQTVLVDNITVNSAVTTFDPVLVGPPADKEQCKKDGWMAFNNPAFENQGECISWVEQNDHAKNTLKTFSASDSRYYDGPTDSAPLYANGPITFTWDKKTGEVTEGYWHEIYPAFTGAEYDNVVVGGTVSGSDVTLNFHRDADNYSFSFTGTLVDDVLTGQMAGPYYFTATAN